MTFEPACSPTLGRVQRARMKAVELLKVLPHCMC